MKKFNRFLTLLGAVFLMLLLFSLFRAIFGAGNTYPPKGIAVLKIKGVITDSDYYLNKLDRLRKEKRVKAIVLRVDSPGGSVVPCQEIYNEILRVKKDKPVVVSMGSVAASGGLYISSAATKIFAEPATITGSIGVIMQTMNFKKVADKVGIKVITVKSGPHKDLLNPFKDIDKGDIEIVQNLINDVYEQFLEAVSKGRGIEVSKLKKIADGRVFSGRQALKFGLVDKLGDLHDAIEEAKVLANAKDAKPFEVKKEKSFFEKLFGDESRVIFGKIANIISGQIESKDLMYLY
ncbi:signal peptide peptidase SppA [Desulfurobacterium atlanticum]|uniref:Signal peptide peptidase A. Serine peptidase. MEROPS family S49 n=1 Tax=Desulfurobacterium atlanticum TaxID=240169 RepID=A0A238Y1V1_9BACT|nr:signal peptide peptidase SppA [Desulfurobacterium atlanticum]SNR64633.1 signal peptide peptidase A. Serine peptidase. MEROPS family S49 [Desulfurobacterium atlanticum]